MNTKQIRGVGCPYPAAKRIVSLLLSLAMLITLTAGIDLYSYAYGDYQYGDYEYDILDDGTAEIINYIGNDAIVAIPSRFNRYTVTSIGAGAFGYCDDLTNVFIPNSVMNIDVYAFEGCESLINVSIPNSVTNIGDYAFYGCESLTNVSIPNSVINIGNNAFDGCSLTEIEIPDSVKNIGSLAFYGCDRLISVTIPSNVISIGAAPFFGCTNLMNIDVDSDNQYYSSQNGVLFDKNKTLLIEYPVGNVREAYSIPSTVEYIGFGAFDGASLISITIPEGVTILEDSAFAHCTNLINISIPSSVIFIGQGAFSGCLSLNRIEIPVGIIEIDFYTFFDCESLTEIVIPVTVTSIMFGAFCGCESLKDIYYGGTKAEWDKIIIDADNDELLYSNIHCVLVANNKFKDIQNGFYLPYSDYIMYTSVYNSFIAGTNPPYYTEFSPTASITRAMLVTILYRMAGEPYANGGNPYKTSPFTDITDPDVYYYDAACWALKNGVTTETTFKPFNDVTREQTATFLYRYAQDIGMVYDDDYKSVNLSRYHDAGSISHFAVDAMKWANYYGMITGTEQGYANPQGATQRIHATKILYHFGYACEIGI